MIKTSKSCDINFANSGRDTEAKTSPRHLNFLKQLNKTTEMLYPFISGFKIHQGTQWVPRNTVTEQIYHIGPNNQKFGHSLRPQFFFCSWASAQVHYYQNLVSEFETKRDVISFIKLIDGWIPFINLTIGLSFGDPINRYIYAYSFLYQFNTKQDCSMLTVS